MVAVFMAGGSGTRLWPLSREDNPKQLHALVGDQSLMAQTVERVFPLIEPRDVWIVTAARYVDRIAEHAPEVSRDHIIAEPFPLGTNLAVGLGALCVSSENPDAVMFVGWADSYIANNEEFRQALARAQYVAPEVDGVILGVKTTYPATGYGYIEMGEPIDGHHDTYRIARFLEKPDPATAVHLHESWKYLWNPGISVWKASRLLDLIAEYKPSHYEALMAVKPFVGTAGFAEAMQKHFADLDREAIDTAVFEKARNLATIPVDLGWSDVGSWSALHEVLAPQGGNVTRGMVVTRDTENCLIYGQDRLIATMGVKDLVVVDAGDAILIAHRDCCDRLKDLHNAIRDAGRTDVL